jgi:hypothetical protein
MNVEDLTTDIAGRLTQLVDAVDALLGADLISAGGRVLVGRIADRAGRYAAGLTGTDPKAKARAAAAVGQLVDLDDPADAGTPLGIAVGLTTDEAVTQAHAAEVLGVSRARVSVLVNTGRLDLVDVDGVRQVTRASVAARLDERSETTR